MKIWKNITLVSKIAACLILLSILLAQQAGTTYGQGNWSTPVPISPEGSFAWFPDVIADQYGKVHTVWAAGATGYDQVIYTYTEDGKKWQPPNDVFAMPWVGTNSAATRPALLIDENGYLNLSFVDLTTVYYSRSSLTKTLTANAWVPKQTMSGDQIAYYSRMAVDSNKKLHFVYTQSTPSEECALCYHLYYRQSANDGNTWSAPVDLMKGGSGAVKPQILIDRSDRVHVVWESGIGGGLGQLANPTSVSYSVSADSGKSWSSPENLSKNAAEMGKNIAIGLDRTGNVVVAWWALPANKIMYQVSNHDGRGWTAPIPISQVWGAAGVIRSNLDDYSFATDSEGYLHLVVVGALSEFQTSLNILNLVWDGSQWAKPDVAATFKGDVPEWPRVSISQGNQLNVVWFVRDEAHIWESDKGQYRVWYARGETGSKLIAPEPLPTAGSGITQSPSAPTQTAQPTRAATPLATSEPLTTTPRQVPQTEADFVPLLAIAILPSLLLIIGLAAFISNRRQ